VSPLIRLRSHRPKAAPAHEPPVDQPPMFRIGLAYDVGRVRTSNEDCVVAMTGLQQGDQAFPYYGLFVVADGMGGHELGERASILAAQTFSHEVITRFGGLWLGRADEQGTSIQDILESAMRSANMAILRELPGSGTTLTTALVFSNQVFLIHVGDSRAYFLGKEIRQLTHDHSLVQRLIDQGHISTDDAARFAQRNVLLKAVGQVENIETDFLTVPWEPGARLLLCSDGLWGVLADDQILKITREHASPQEAAQALIRQANIMGGPDNISVLLVELIGEK
jgi:PPM family protein phosphatase